jgi:hypothetical protein
MQQTNYLKQLLIFVACLLAVVPYILFINQYPTVVLDEPWYGSTIYNLALNGVIQNTLFGYAGGDVQYAYPFLSAIWVKLFGFSLLKLRLLSVFLGGATLFVFLKCLRQLNVQARWVVIFGAVLFVMNNNLFIIFRRIRPEALVLFCFFVSLYYYLKWLNNNTNKWALVGCGAAIMTAFWAHPSAFIYGIVLGVFILWDQIKSKQPYKIGYYILGNGLVFCVGLLGFMVLSDQSWLHGLLFKPEISASTRIGADLASIGGRLTLFFSAYSMGIKRLYIICFELLVLGVPFWLLKYYPSAQGKTGLFLTRLAGIGVVSLCVSFILFSPFPAFHFSYIVCIGLLVFLGVLQAIKSRHMRWVVLCISSVYLVNNVAGNIYVVYKNRQNESLANIKHQIEQTINASIDGEMILGSPYFWFLQPSNYYLINRTRMHPQNLEPNIIIDFPKVLNPTTRVSQEHVSVRPQLPPQIDAEKYQYYQINTQAYGDISIWKRVSF